MPASLTFSAFEVLTTWLKRVEAIPQWLLHSDRDDQRVHEDGWRAGCDALQGLRIEAVGVRLVSGDDQRERGAFAGRLHRRGERSDAGALVLVSHREAYRAGGGLERLGGFTRRGIVANSPQDLLRILDFSCENESSTPRVGDEARRRLRGVLAGHVSLPLPGIPRQLQLAFDVVEGLGRRDDAGIPVSGGGPDEGAVER